MADDSQPDPSHWDGPIPGDPDPEEIGPASQAWYALHGELEGDPAEILAWAAGEIAAQLEDFEPGAANPLAPGQASVAILDARRFLGMIAEIFGRSELPADDEAAFAFRAELKRSRGRPVKTGKLRPQSLEWWGVAREVEALIVAGEMQKVAVGKVADRLGLKDAVVAGWYRKRRKAVEKSKRRFGNMDKSAN